MNPHLPASVLHEWRWKLTRSPSHFKHVSCKVIFAVTSSSNKTFTHMFPLGMFMHKVVHYKPYCILENFLTPCSRGMNDINKINVVLNSLQMSLLQQGYADCMCVHLKFNSPCGQYMSNERLKKLVYLTALVFYGLDWFMQSLSRMEKRG